MIMTTTMISMRLKPRSPGLGAVRLARTALVTSQVLVGTKSRLLSPAWGST
jgi:hypothetical protein